MGLTLTDFDQSVLKDVQKGIKRMLPQKPDTRPAFLLPNYCLPSIFKCPLSSSHLIMKSAVIFGFLGMFRFSTYDKLGLHNLVLVAADGEEMQITEGTNLQVESYLQHQKIIGFYFQFAAKYHPVAHAFFCSLSNISEF